MILALLLAAAAPSAVDAERAFAADAQTIGQGSAFRKWAEPDAVMFTPRPVKVREFLKNRKNPAKAIEWWPTESYVSCDGKLAVNTGGWKRPDGSVGYFSTVWRRQADGGWKWIVDHGDALPAARQRPTNAAARKASCEHDRRVMPVAGVVGVRGPLPTGVETSLGGSKDQSLNWLWIVKADDSRTFMASYWDGHEMIDAIDDEVAAPE